jgi:hypothetical protein
MFLGIWASIGSMVALGASGNDLMPATVFGALSLMWGLLILGLILAVIFGVFFTIGIANMAYYNSEIGAAFRFREMLDTINAIGWVDYIIWYIMMIILGMIIAAIAGVLGLIPILGWALIVLALYPYLYLVYARALGLLFVSGLETQ